LPITFRTAAGSQDWGTSSLIISAHPSARSQGRAPLLRHCRCDSGFWITHTAALVDLRDREQHYDGEPHLGKTADSCGFKFPFVGETEQHKEK
jgi:hypothetical protein